MFLCSGSSSTRFLVPGSTAELGWVGRKPGQLPVGSEGLCSALGMAIRVCLLEREGSGIFGATKVLSPPPPGTEAGSARFLWKRAIPWTEGGVTCSGLLGVGTCSGGGGFCLVLCPALGLGRPSTLRLKLGSHPHPRGALPPTYWAAWPHVPALSARCWTLKGQHPSFSCLHSKDDAGRGEINVSVVP